MTIPQKIAAFDEAMQKGMKWLVKLAELILIAGAFQVVAVSSNSIAVKLFALLLTMIVAFFAIGPITTGAGLFLKSLSVKSRVLFWIIAGAYLLLVAKVCLDVQASLNNMIRTVGAATAAQAGVEQAPSKKAR